MAISVAIIMDFFNAVWHLLGFIAPAAWMAACLVVMGRLIPLKKAQKPLFARIWIQQFAILLIVGVLILGAGLVVFGRDGKMWSYAALVLGLGAVQWWLGGAWRR
jgi:hypothetical protein